MALNSLLVVISSLTGSVCRSVGDQTHMKLCLLLWFSHHWSMLCDLWPDCLWNICQWWRSWYIFAFTKKNTAFSLEV